MKIVSTVALSLVTIINGIFSGNNINSESYPKTIVTVSDTKELIESKDSIFILTSFKTQEKEGKLKLKYPLNKKDMKCQCKTSSKEISDSSSRICSGFGRRYHPIYKYHKFHAGIDFSAKENSIILSSSDGIVSKIGYNSGYGKYIEITEGDYKLLYAHCNKILVKQGDLITSGDSIGLVGSTGIATGPHIHFEITKNGKLINPEELLDNDYN